MSATFANSLRVRDGDIRVAAADATDTIRVRVEMPEVWDVVRVIASPGDTVMAVKIQALDALSPSTELHQDVMVKFRGWEILDEAQTLAESGIVDGSILLITYRRRRAVR